MQVLNVNLLPIFIKLQSQLTFKMKKVEPKRGKWDKFSKNIYLNFHEPIRLILVICDGP